MITVQNAKRTIPGLARARAMLLASVAGAIAHAGPAIAQDAGSLFGDGPLVLDGATTPAQNGIPAAAYDPYSAGSASDPAAADTAGPDGADPRTTATATQPAPSKSVLAPETPTPVLRAPPAKAVGPVQSMEVAPDADPFAPTGLRFGSFILKPTLEMGLTGSRKKSANSLLGDSTLRLQLDSDWARHALNVTASGRLERTIAGGDDLEPELDVNANGRLDIGKDTTLTGTFAYNYQLDDGQSAAFKAATDPSLSPVVTGTNSPATQTLDGSLTLRQDFGRVFGEAGVSAGRTIYGSADLSDGTSISQHDLDNNVYDARLRTGFELSPVLSPFVEGSYGIRRMDVTPDTGGVDRNATRYGLRLGTAVDLGEKLNGEIAVGFIKEDIADAALEDIAGVSVDATINWSPRRETDVSLALSTTTETSGSAGSSGALLYTADLGVTHRVRANLTAEAGFGAEYRDARGEADEVTLNGSAALTYWFNRFAGLTTRIGHEQTLSNDAAKRTDKTTAFVGLKLQR